MIDEKKDKMKVFANLKQQKFLGSRAQIKDFLGGRGCAKTDTIGKVVGMAYREMPRAKLALAGVTYVTIDLVTLPVIKESLEYMGIYEYSKANPFGHYVVGKIPPETWASPYKKVGRLGYQYCMSFINGFTIQFVSQDRAETHRGLNIDGLLVDEAATVSEDFIYKILKKAIRGNTHKKISKSIFFHCHYQFSSAAWYQEGMHIYRNEELAKKEFEEREKWPQSQLKKIPPKHLILEATCLDNPLSGQKYWDEQKSGEDPLVFDVEVANIRLTSLPDGFYHAFKTSRHLYWEKQRYEYDDKTGLHLMHSNDYREDKALDITLDFNAKICWAVVLQEVKDEVRIINSNFVKPTLVKENPNDKEAKETTDIVVQNAKWFCKTYINHPKKEVNIYGDPSGNAKNSGTSDTHRPDFDRFQKELKANGWTVFRKESKSRPAHKRKYRLVNDMFSEESNRLPKIRINQHTNKVLILQIQSTPVNENYEKVKKSEKNLPLKHREYAPDGTDALDYYLWTRFHNRLPDSMNQQNQLYIYRPR